MAIDFGIRNIIKSDGHIKIDDMMREVLRAHSDSYYRKIRNIGIKGDFITSPEISQLFGEMIGLWAIEKWQQLGRPGRFTLLELGPGQGKLMQDFLRVAKLVPEFYKAAEIYLLEINQYFIKKQRARLEQFDKEITWISDVKKLPEDPLIIIANEFFDALPIKQYVKVKTKWFESVLVVDPVDGRIKYSKMAIKDLLQKQLLLDHPNAQDGAILEESVESLDITRILSKHLKSYCGAALIIDYGYDINTETRDRGQYNSTLQAVKNHQYSSIIETLGEADVTAHVDFNALKKAAYEQAVRDCFVSSQREFLLKYGIELRLSELKKKVTTEQADILNKQVFRLISEKQMGQLFKVLELMRVVGG
jgi:SAM-dependent MidA family methyltransferase